MTNETKEKENTTKEKIEAVGQIIIGEIEEFGGILTGDPITVAEGKLAVEAGTLHRKSADVLEEADENGEEEKAEDRAEVKSKK